MKNKNKKSFRIVLSITSWILCALSSSFGYGFLGGMSWSFQARFLADFLLMMAPLSVTWLIFELFRTEESHTEK